jgi:hypothetical protein
MNTNQPLTQAALDGAQCEHPDCDHTNHAPNQPLYLHQGCHQHVGLAAMYSPATGLLTIKCFACDERICDIKVAEH